MRLLWQIVVTLMVAVAVGTFASRRLYARRERELMEQGHLGEA